GLEVEVSAGSGPAVVSEDPVLASDPRPRTLIIEAARLMGVDPARIVARVRSELPAGRGLGRSAAVAGAPLRALAAAMAREPDAAVELAAGRGLEAVFHGPPSGIDPAAAALGTCIRFVRGEPPSVTPVHPAVPLPVVVAFGERPRSTGAAVGGLRAR